MGVDFVPPFSVTNQRAFGLCSPHPSQSSRFLCIHELSSDYGVADFACAVIYGKRRDPSRDLFELSIVRWASSQRPGLTACSTSRGIRGRLPGFRSLHFLSQNSLHFAVADSIVPLAVVLSCTTGSMAALWLALRDWHRSSLVTSIILVSFFGYGHISHAVDDRVDERIFFACVVVVTGALVMLILRATSTGLQWTRFLNVVSVVLLTLSVVSLVSSRLDSQLRAQPSEVTTSELVAHLLPGGIPEVSSPRPDIYYIILDEYTRDEALGRFDNSQFISEFRRPWILCRLAGDEQLQ